MGRSTEGAERAGWRADAACRPLDSALFFPDRMAYRNDEVARAKAVCRKCPVRVQCLTAAMDGREKTGIWGGLTPMERANLRRRERRARAIRETPALGLAGVLIDPARVGSGRAPAGPASGRA